MRRDVLTPASCFLSPEAAQPRSAPPADSSGKIGRFEASRVRVRVSLTPPLSLAVGADYQDVEVHLRRQKTGFGFRVLGGDEAGQPVSPETREKARMAKAPDLRPRGLSNKLTERL